MAEIQLGGHTYRTGRLNALQQDRIVRRLSPLVASLGDALPKLMSAFPKPVEGDVEGKAAPEAKVLDGSALAALEPLLKAVAAIPDADADMVFAACLGTCQRQLAGAAGWSTVWSSGGLMFEDLDLISMYRLTAEVLRENLSGFFSGLLPASKGAAAKL